MTRLRPNRATVIRRATEHPSEPSTPQPRADNDDPKQDRSLPSEQPEQVYAPETQKSLAAVLDNLQRKRAKRSSQQGKRINANSERSNGYAVGAQQPFGPKSDIAIAATLRALGLRSARTLSEIPSTQRNPMPTIGLDDLRVKIRQARSGSLLLFVVDSSGSMGARKRMTIVKGVILDLLSDAYRKRDQVGMIVFRGEDATLVVPPTNSVELAEQRLRQLPTGGKTPLTAGLHLAHQVLDSQLRQNPGLMPLLILITDGKGNIGVSPKVAAAALAKKPYPILVLDSEQGYVRMGDAKQLAEMLNCAYASLEQLPNLLGIEGDLPK